MKFHDDHDADDGDGGDDDGDDGGGDIHLHQPPNYRTR